MRKTAESFIEEDCGGRISCRWMILLLERIPGAAIFTARAARRKQKERLAEQAARDLNNLLFVVLGKSDSAGFTQQLLRLIGKELGESEDLNLNKTMRDTEGTFRRRFGVDIKCLLRLDPHLGLVRANREQLKQVVMNLVANARDAMPGGGTVTIETDNSNHAFVTFRVTDTGQGMSTETEARLFEPAFTTKEPGNGAGQGLAVVHRIVTNIGGTIQVKSKLGRGTAFTIHIPRVGASVLRKCNLVQNASA